MFFTIFACLTEDGYLALPRFSCRNNERMFSQTFTLRIR